MRKRIIALGDSITVGTFTAPTDRSPDTVAHPNYIELTKEALGYTELLNYARNGISISPASPTLPDRAMCRRIDLMEDGDLLIIAGGTNDYAASVPLGSPTDTDEFTFYGALDVLYKKVSKKYKDAKVYVITPLKRKVDGENEKGHTLADYRKAIEEKAKEYSFPTIDGYLVPIDPKTEEGRQAHILDGLHPNEEGHRLYAEFVISKIRELCSE